MKDKKIAALMKAEASRQKKVINLIASENFVSQDVLKALGSELTNKYAEGYAGKRYYGGQTYIDQIENLAIDRALKLFNLKNTEWAVNVQPLSGSPANLAVYVALVPLGEKIMGMELAHGGHLTHGHSVSFTGKAWKQVGFQVSKDTEMLDYDSLKKLAVKEKPALIVAGFTAYPRVIDFKKFREIANACGALLMVDMSHTAGLVAGKALPSPFAYADIVTTTTHKTLRGPRSGLIFSKIDDRELHKKINRAVFPGLQGGPHMNQIAAVAVTLAEANTGAFKKYAKQVIKNAQAMSKEFQKLGWRIVSGGTDTHLILLDTWSKGIGGQAASDALENAGVIVNKNTIPFDTRTPTDPSGIRIGTAAITTRGAKEKDAVKIAQKINNILMKIQK